METLLSEIRSCNHCAAHLPHGTRPVLQAGKGARILIAGQAPGRKVHESGVPFDDASGDRLRDWMGVGFDTFYDAERIAILPMGFCYPGTGKSGDLPPRRECAPLWRQRLLEQLPDIELTLVIGGYALDWHLPDRAETTLTATVRNWRKYPENILLLPHPSPRNNIWLKKNPWFETDLLPELKARCRRALFG
ncbi:uracil-DNA glycosylase family protein [Kordiimonas lipolytica]|uniref:Uracil-DNA glycosylase family protein n=1 Tax=Kordiimonas lipolytica TaxID=1662421 RepID=A0ABV8UBZ1_9PROT|nr:uracil-DNA glycosylase family protein [Kordiimonas lipolytica]